MEWTRRALGAAGLAVVLGAAGCGSSVPSDVPATEGSASVDASSWTGTDLLPAAGEMTRVGEIGVYFAADVFQYTLAAIDITTGRERWRQPVNQQGRIRGVVQRPTVDPGTGLVFATTKRSEEPAVAAFELTTGALRWTAPLPELASDTPELCGNGSLCVLTVDGAMTVLGRTDGSSRATGRALDVVIGGAGDLVVTGDPQEGLVELGRLSDDGYTPIWRRSYAELFGDSTTYSQDGGWSVWVDEATGGTVVTVGPSIPPDDPDGELDLQRIVSPGGATAFLDPAGTVLAQVTGTSACYSAQRSADRIPLCRAVAVEDGDPPRVLTGEVSMCTQAGVLLWQRALPVPADEDSITGTGAPDTLALVDDDGSTVVVAAGTGAAVDLPDATLLACPGEGGADIHVPLTGWRPTIIRYLRLELADVAVPCRADGTVVPVDEALRDGLTLPAGLGPSTVADGADPSPADAWVVVVTVDGTLSGHRPPTS